MKLYYERTCDGYAVAGADGRLVDLTIPETVNGKKVVAIADAAFAGRLELESVTIPVGVTRVGADAFRGCSNLKSVVFPKGLRRIMYRAFSECVGLETVKLRPGLELVAVDAFRGCRRLRRVELPEGASTLGARAFSGCVNLRFVTIPKSLTSSALRAFEDCLNLDSNVLRTLLDRFGRETFVGLLPELRRETSKHADVLRLRVNGILAPRAARRPLKKAG